MNPEEVNSSKFKVEQILYNHEGFSIAYGNWTESNQKCTAMRWNGEETALGYPNNFGNPTWFLLPQSLSESLLKTLLGLDGANNKEITTCLLETYL